MKEEKVCYHALIEELFECLDRDRDGINVYWAKRSQIKQKVRSGKLCPQKAAQFEEIIDGAKRHSGNNRIYRQDVKQFLEFTGHSIAQEVESV